MKKFYVHVIGCQQNDHDGARIRYLFGKLGLVETMPEQADLIIVVACAVRQSAVDRVFGNIRNWQKISSKSIGKKPTILATGCVLEHDKKKLEKIGIKFWNIEKPEELAELLGLGSKRQIAKLLSEGAKFSSSVPIMFGCNNFCTYCATAFTRGRERSRKVADIITEAKALIKSGREEILLLGQTVNSYKDPASGERLEDLLRRLNALPGDFTIAFTSNHPKDMTDGLIEAAATLPKVKKEIHLPLQSGSDKILKAMKRPYNIKEYLEIVRKIQRQSPKIAITTDIIVGFPGEEEDDFQETVKIFRKVRFSHAYINKYSPRPGTAAFKLGDPVPWQEKRRRWRILNAMISNKEHKVSYK